MEIQQELLQILQPNLPSTAQETLSKSAIIKRDQCLTLFGSIPNLLNAYSPDQTQKFLQDKDRMIISDKAPTMATIKNAFGASACKALLNSYILDLSKFYGVPVPEADQVDSICDSILFSHHDLKATEYMLFFSMMKAGEFRDEKGKNIGKMYGSFSGDVIIDCLYMFRKYRNQTIDRINNQNMKRELDARQENPASDEERKQIFMEAAKNNPMLLNIAKSKGWI